MEIKNSPHQEVFQECRKVAIEVIGNANVYDYLPPKGTNYPFFFIGEQFSNDNSNKSTVIPRITQRIHFYSNDFKKRGTASKLINDFMYKIRLVENTKHFYIQVSNISNQMLADNTTDTPLMHGVIDVEFLCY